MNMSTILELDFEDDGQPVFDFKNQTFIECEHEQGSPEWHQDRLGIVTGTGIQKIVTSTGKASTQAETYMNQLIADLEGGEPLDYWEGNKDIENGNEREPLAREFYEFITGEKVREVGFCFKDEKRNVGCSPDGLIGDDGLIEIKCPKASTLIGYRRKKKIPTAYVHQIQSQLWIMGRQWCDFLAWHPKIKHFQIRVERDEKYIAILEDQIGKFNLKLIEATIEAGNEPAA